MKKDISKTIVFRFSNNFTKSIIFTISLPYLPFYAADGFYSRLYKRVKESATFGFEKSLVHGKKWIELKKSYRTVISLPSGLSLDMPYDVNGQDINIINHYLEGLKMSVVNVRSYSSQRKSIAEGGA